MYYVYDIMYAVPSRFYLCIYSNVIMVTVNELWKPNNVNSDCLNGLI